jgi:small subunit ribosomal protein S20
LAHSRSALKRWRQSIQRRDRNRSVKSHTRTLLRKALSVVDGDPSEAEADVRAALSALDRAAQKGVIHPNAAARSKSRLLKRFNLSTASAVAAAAVAGTEAEKPARAPRRRAAAQPTPEKPAGGRTTRGRTASNKPAEPKTPRPRTRKPS